MERYALKKVKIILATDKITQDFYNRLYPQYSRKIKIIPTGVNLEYFKPMDKIYLRKKTGLHETDKIILYIGRIEPPKKVDEIIKAFKILYQKNMNFKLLIVGDGTQLNEMKQLVQELNLNKSVTFMGYRKRDELPEIINYADISVLYSGNEGS